jgi:hypothetical protein
MAEISNFQQFDLRFRNSAGSTTPVPNLTIKVFDATNLVDLPDLISDENGQVAGGTLEVPPGTVVRFSGLYLGLPAGLTQKTT